LPSVSLHKSPEECQHVWDCQHRGALTAPILLSMQEKSFLIIFVSLLYKFIPSQQPIHTAWLSWTSARAFLIQSTEHKQKMEQNTQGERQIFDSYPSNLSNASLPTGMQGAELCTLKLTGHLRPVSIFSGLISIS